MNNTIVDDMRFLFEKVDNGEMTTEQAIEKFFFVNGGNKVYLPKYLQAKKYKIIQALKRKLSIQQIHLRYNVSKSYVYKIKRQLV